MGDALFMALTATDKTIGKRAENGTRGIILCCNADGYCKSNHVVGRLILQGRQVNDKIISMILSAPPQVFMNVEILTPPYSSL